MSGQCLPDQTLLKSSGCLADLEHCGPAGTTSAPIRRSTVLHRDLLGVLDLSGLSTLHTVSGHGILLDIGTRQV